MRLSARLLLTLFILLATTWGALALTYRLDWAPLAGYTLVTLWCLLRALALVLLWRRPPLSALVIHLLAFAVLLAWWYSLQPSNQRAWADDVAHMTQGRVVGEQLLLDNVRNFDWRSDQDYDIAWESRSYDLRQLASIDLLTS